ncbi:reverse transcriptase domain-containing protein [Tanacetum coccineum]
MSTRSSSSNLVPPSSDPESIIRNRRRNLGDPSLLLNFEEINMANNPNNVQGPPPAGAAQTWLEKEPPNSITTWNDLVSKFVNRFFPPSRTTNLRNEITRFQQRFAGGNLLTKNTQEALTIIKNKSKVRTSRNKPQDSNASGSSSKNDAITALPKQVEALVSSMNKPIHSIQEGCVTCGGPHPY